jgi:hypothetical protein
VLAGFRFGIGPHDVAMFASVSIALDPWSDLLGCHVGVRADVL